MDLISRQAAINTVFSMCCRWDTEDADDLKNMLMLAFQELPSAQSEVLACGEGELSAETERKKGKWIIDRHGNWACDQCGNDPYHCNMENMNFCPNCGADMRGEEE